MKNLISLALLVMLAACDSKATTKSAGATNQTEDSQAADQFSCSMHPEVTGKKDDKCSKCGMNLTEPVQS